MSRLEKLQNTAVHSFTPFLDECAYRPFGMLQDFANGGRMQDTALQPHTPGLGSAEASVPGRKTCCLREGGPA